MSDSWAWTLEPIVVQHRLEKVARFGAVVVFPPLCTAWVPQRSRSRDCPARGLLRGHADVARHRRAARTRLRPRTRIVRTRRASPPTGRREGTGAAGRRFSGSTSGGSRQTCSCISVQPHDGHAQSGHAAAESKARLCFACATSETRRERQGLQETRSSSSSGISGRRNSAIPAWGRGGIPLVKKQGYKPSDQQKNSHAPTRGCSASASRRDWSFQDLASEGTSRSRTSTGVAGCRATAGTRARDADPSASQRSCSSVADCRH